MDLTPAERAGFVRPSDPVKWPGSMDRYQDRRFTAAVACLQGLLADSTAEGSAVSFARSAVQYADALLKELES